MDKLVGWPGNELARPRVAAATRGDRFLINQASQSVLNRLLWHDEMFFIINVTELSCASTSEISLRTVEVAHVFLPSYC